MHQMQPRQYTSDADWNRPLAYWIAFGPHGPRTVRGMGTLWLNIRWTAAAVAFSLVLFVIIRSFAGPAPRTMNEQWQKMTNDYLKVRCYKSPQAKSVCVFLLWPCEGSFTDLSRLLNRSKKWNPLPVYRQKVTRAKAWSKVRLSRVGYPRVTMSRRSRYGLLYVLYFSQSTKALIHLVHTWPHPLA